MHVSSSRKQWLTCGKHHCRKPGTAWGQGSLSVLDQVTAFRLLQLMGWTYGMSQQDGSRKQILAGPSDMKNECFMYPLRHPGHTLYRVMVVKIPQSQGASTLSVALGDHRAGQTQPCPSWLTHKHIIRPNDILDVIVVKFGVSRKPKAVGMFMGSPVGWVEALSCINTVVRADLPVVLVSACLA